MNVIYFQSRLARQMEEMLQGVSTTYLWGKLSLDLDVAGTLQNNLMNVIENENLASDQLC
jgi:hypothetical protein